jgi:hypothetical protein
LRQEKNRRRVASVVEAPAHLRDVGASWWRAVREHYKAEDPIEDRLLVLAAEALDRCVEARQVVERDGCTVVDRFGQQKEHPACAVEVANRGSFHRLVAALRPAEGAPSPSELATRAALRRWDPERGSGARRYS